MKTLYIILATSLLLSAQTASAQSSLGTLATAENYRAAQSVGRDIRAKRYDKATSTVLTHKEVKRRTKMTEREIELAKNPRATASAIKKDPLTFAEKHKSSFWDRFRLFKKSKRSTKK